VQIPRRVIQQVLDAGYADSLQVADPSAAQTSGTFSAEHPGQRVDYIFTGNLDASRIRCGWIVYDGDAPKASDHFPVGVEIGE